MKPSTIALGCVTFGREIDRTASFALMDHAVSRGVRLFDTAAAYGGGASEEIIGEWLARKTSPADLVIATKILPPYSPDRIAEAVALSQRRLGLPKIPLLFLHRWDESVANPDSIAALDRLIRTGKVRALGASNFTSAQLAAFLDLQRKGGATPLKAIQNNHNFAVRDVDPELRALCAQAGLSIITYSPLGAGFLSGKHQSGVQPGSRFAIIPGHQQVYFIPEAEKRLAALQALGQRLGTTTIPLALIWALHQPGIESVLVGGRSPAHLDQAFEAAAAPASLVAEVNACCS